MTVEPMVMDLKTLLAPFSIDAPEIGLTDLVLDSREVAIHKGFLAIKGHQQDGREFIPQAVSLGAKVILSDTDDESAHGQMSMREHSLIVEFFQLAENVAELAQQFFSDPTQQLSTIAVTGTNGKTSTTHFCCQLAQSLGQKSVFVGTLGQGSLNDLRETINTTPDAISMQRIAYQSLQEQAQIMAFEASSHALVQERTAHINTNVAIFTNLTRDHLDYHGTMKAYAAAKRRLLKQPALKTVVLNADDPESSNWLAHKPGSVVAVLIGIDTEVADTEKFCIARNVALTNSGLSFELHTSWGNTQVQVPLFGRFNVYNLVSAASAMLALGHGIEAVTDALALIQPVSGRAERYHHDDYADTIVDYAHTPDALENILCSLRGHVSGRIVCVFGCGGERDQGKRPMMGRIAEQYSDAIILTNDNVRSEDAQAIANDILSGIHDTQKVQVELDRQAAIKMAVSQSSKEDLILVAGKGHEDYQIIGTTKIKYDERQFINKLYSEGLQ